MEREKYQDPSPTKGVVGLTVEQHQNYKRYSFDSYIKKSLKREAWAGYREIRKKLSCEISIEDLPQDAMEELSVTDFYPWEHVSFRVAGTVIVIENEALALALEKLPLEDRNIILMYWFLDMADKEISCHLCIARRTVNDRRRKSYQKLKEWMRGECCEQKCELD